MSVFSPHSLGDMVRISARPPGRGLRLLLGGLLGFCLAPCALGPLLLPVLPGLLLALPGDWTALPAGLLGAVSALLFLEKGTALSLVGALGLALFFQGLFHFLNLWKRSWVRRLGAALSAGVFALGGGLVGGAEPALLWGSVLLWMGGSVLGQEVFYHILHEKKPFALDLGLGLLILGLGQLPGPWGGNWGYVLGAVGAGGSLPMALLCGLGLDALGLSPAPMSAMLPLSFLLRKKLGYAAPAIPVLGLLAWGVGAGGMDLPLAVSLALGGVLGLFLWKSPPAQEETLGPSRDSRLMAASNALGLLAHGLVQEEDRPLSGEISRRGCAGCARWDRCWNEPGERELALAGAMPQLLRGEDVPPALLHHCPRPEAFRQAVLQGVETHRLRGQYDRRLRESRLALTRQYEAMSRLLQTMALGDSAGGSQKFYPEVACAASPGGSRSGDRALWFPGPAGDFFVLLCDGMGRGVPAARAGKEAARLLRALLQAGLTPEEALGTLNDQYVLRGRGGYCTADLLRLHGDTGRAELYKWGGAPSYLLQEGKVQVIGQAAPPPGLSMEQEPEVTRLWMKNGQRVILVSDGLAGEALPSRLAQYHALPLRRLVRTLVEERTPPGTDDCTAVAVCLQAPGSGSIIA